MSLGNSIHYLAFFAIFVAGCGSPPNRIDLRHPAFEAYQIGFLSTDLETVDDSSDVEPLCSGDTGDSPKEFGQPVFSKNDNVYFSCVPGREPVDVAGGEHTGSASTEKATAVYGQIFTYPDLTGEKAIIFVGVLSLLEFDSSWISRCVAYEPNLSQTQAYFGGSNYVNKSLGGKTEPFEKTGMCQVGTVEFVDFSDDPQELKITFPSKRVEKATMKKFKFDFNSE